MFSRSALRLSEFLAKHIRVQHGSIVAGDDSSTEAAANFATGWWPQEIFDLLTGLEEPTGEAEGGRPSQALAWAGRHMQRKLWRPLWTLRKEVRESTAEAEDSTTEESDAGQDDSDSD